MKSQLVRLALVQVAIVLYMVLAAAVLLKCVYGSPAPAVFARYVRDYGALLFSIPIAWCIYTMLIEHNPEHSWNGSPLLLVFGWILAALLVALAIYATQSAARPLFDPMSMHAAPPPAPSRMEKWMTPSNP